MKLTDMEKTEVFGLGLDLADAVFADEDFVKTFKLPLDDDARTAAKCLAGQVLVTYLTLDVKSPTG